MKLGIIRVSESVLKEVLRLPEGCRIVGVQQRDKDPAGFYFAPPRPSESVEIEVKVEWDGLSMEVSPFAVLPVYRYSFSENDLEGKFEY